MEKKYNSSLECVKNQENPIKDGKSVKYHETVQYFSCQKDDIIIPSRERSSKESLKEKEKKDGNEETESICRYACRRDGSVIKYRSI